MPSPGGHKGEPAGSEPEDNMRAHDAANRDGSTEGVDALTAGASTLEHAKHSKGGWLVRSNSITQRIQKAVGDAAPSISSPGGASNKDGILHFLSHRQRRASQSFMFKGEEQPLEEEASKPQRERLASSTAAADAATRDALLERIRRECPLFSMDEIQHMCAEFRYAVSELTADTALSPVPLTASSKRSTVDMAEEIPIENLRLDVVQVEYVVRDVLRVAVTHDVLQELLQVELNRSYDEAYARVSKGAPAPIAECTLDFVRFARLVHEIKKLLSRTSVSWFPFDPTSITRRSWDVFILALLIYTSIEVPYSLAFDSSLDTVGLLVDLIFCFDVFLNFCTAQLIDGKFITDMKHVALLYLKGWFAIDVAGSFPFDRVAAAIIGADDSLQSLTFVRVIKMVRLLKLLRVVRMMAAINAFEERHGTQGLKKAMRMAKSLFLLFFVSHMIGCLFFLLIPVDGSLDNWLYSYSPNLILASDFEKYTVGLYWAVVTISTMGYGDVVPVTHGERMFSIFCALLGACVFSYSMGNITSVITSTTSVGSVFEERMRLLSDYLDFRKLPDDFVRRVKAQYLYTWKNHKDLYKEDEILACLPSGTRREILLQIAMKRQNYTPLFRGLEDECIAALNMRLTFARYDAGDVLYRGYEVGNEMFLIITGDVSVLPVSEQMEEKVVGRGQPLGLMNLFPVICKYRAETARAVSTTDVFILTREHFEEVVAEFPEMGAKMRKVALLLSMNARVNNSVMQRAIGDRKTLRMTKLDVLIAELKGNIRNEMEEEMIQGETASDSSSLVFHAWKLNKYTPLDHDDHLTVQQELEARRSFARSVNNWRRRLFVVRKDGEIVYASEKIPDVYDEMQPMVKPSITSIGWIMPGSEKPEFPKSKYTGFRFSEYVFAFRVASSRSVKESKTQTTILACESEDDFQRFCGVHHSASTRSVDADALGRDLPSLERQNSINSDDAPLSARETTLGLSEVAPGGFTPALQRNAPGGVKRSAVDYDSVGASLAVPKGRGANPKIEEGGAVSSQDVVLSSPTGHPEEPASLESANASPVPCFSSTANGDGGGVWDHNEREQESPPSAADFGPDLWGAGGLWQPQGRHNLVGTPSSIVRQIAEPSVAKRLEALESMPESVQALAAKVDRVHGSLHEVHNLLEQLLASQGITAGALPPVRGGPVSASVARASPQQEVLVAKRPFHLESVGPASQRLFADQAGVEMASRLPTGPASQRLFADPTDVATASRLPTGPASQRLFADPTGIATASRLPMAALSRREAQPCRAMMPLEVLP